MSRRTGGRETFYRLLEWDRGQADTERLAALILRGEGFSDIDPSHPRGGTDGKKDIAFKYNGEKWIAGIYFPRGQKKPSEIKKKFIQDISGVAMNDSVGFAFITNQEIKLAERKKLTEQYPDIDVEIYHLERIAGILNSPQNYGLRLEFLDIEMTKEEQVSFFSAGMANVDMKLNQLSVNQDEFKNLFLAFMDNNNDEYAFDAPRSMEEIAEMANEFCEKVWYDRHLVRCTRMERGTENIKPEIWEGALASAQKVVAKYGEENLSPYNRFDWGMINGKLSALRWVMGEDWDELYT
jgi:hypothetical protein